MPRSEFPALLTQWRKNKKSLARAQHNESDSHFLKRGKKKKLNECVSLSGLGSSVMHETFFLNYYFVMVDYVQNVMYKKRTWLHVVLKRENKKTQKKENPLNNTKAMLSFLLQVSLAGIQTDLIYSV